MSPFGDMVAKGLKPVNSTLGFKSQNIKHSGEMIIIHKVIHHKLSALYLELVY